jgi:ribonuclease HI
VEITPWRLFFDGSVCNKGRGIGCVMILPHGMQYELSVKLEFMCTNNQAEYEVLLYGLRFLRDMGVRVVEALGDSKLVVQQVKGESQCLDGALNCYRDKCLDIIKTLEAFRISHIPREENRKANELAQQASGYEIKKGLFVVEERPAIMPESMTHGELVDGPTRLMVQFDLGGTSASKENKVRKENQTRPAVHDGNVDAEVPKLVEVGNDEHADWRQPLMKYLLVPEEFVSHKIRRQALRYSLVDGEMYRRTVDGLLLKCLD